MPPYIQQQFEEQQTLQAQGQQVPQQYKQSWSGQRQQAEQQQWPCVQQRVPSQQQTAKVVIRLATGQYVDTAQDRGSYLYLPKSED